MKIYNLVIFCVGEDFVFDLRRTPFVYLRKTIFVYFWTWGLVEKCSEDLCSLKRILLER